MISCIAGANHLSREQEQDRKRKAAIAQLSALAVGGLRFCPGVTLEAAHRVRIDGDKSVPVQIDGEVLGQLPLDITIHPKQLAIILP